MGAQVLDIAQRYRADFVIAHLFGRSPSVSIKELKRVGYPLRKVVSFVWGSAEADIEAAGGFAVAEGYYAMQFAGVGTDYPVLNEIREMYKKQGKPAPKEMASTVFYNRGVLIAAMHVEAIRNALKAKPDGKITGVDVKKGFEKIKGFTLGGLVPPLEVTPAEPRGRRAGADLAGQGRQVREGDGLVRGVPGRGGQAHQGGWREEVTRVGGSGVGPGGGASLRTHSLGAPPPGRPRAAGHRLRLRGATCAGLDGDARA